jgi:hypothetical protein
MCEWTADSHCSWSGFFLATPNALQISAARKRGDIKAYLQTAA